MPTVGTTANCPPKDKLLPELVIAKVEVPTPIELKLDAAVGISTGVSVALA